MKKAKPVYPDLSDIHARKQRGRQEAANRTLGEKIAVVEAMRERLAPLKLAREAARKKRSQPGSQRSKD